MFSTILKAVTGYFDRQSTLTTFFPLLLFWGVVVVVVFSHYVGWAGTLARWNGVTGTAQALLIVAFLSWVALWTFFMLNFRAGLLRFFEGELLDSVHRGRLLVWRRRRWERAMARLEGCDASLEEREIFLKQEAREWEAFPPDVLPAQPVPPAEGVANLVARWQSLSTARPDAQSGDEAVADLGRKVRQASLATVPVANAEEKEQLATLVTSLQEAIERRIEEVRAQRAVLYYRLSRYFPQNAVLAPTRLGNAMRAVDTYSQPRYGLDLATIWPRLQPLLPAETLSWLGQAGTAFDLMITLSALSALFGVSLGVYLAVISSSPQAAAISAVVLAGSLGLSWVCYRNAVEAAVAYGERVRSTVDLHRFRVLEAMRLPQPENLAEEELEWRRVCGLLDRSDQADPAAWRYVPTKEGNDGGS
jgi:hypothetical protein